MKKYYQTLREAKKALKQNPYGYDLRIWDLGKHRKKEDSLWALSLNGLTLQDDKI